MGLTQEEIDSMDRMALREAVKEMLSKQESSKVLYETANGSHARILAYHPNQYYCYIGEVKSEYGSWRAVMWNDKGESVEGKFFDRYNLIKIEEKK